MIEQYKRNGYCVLEDVVGRVRAQKDDVHALLRTVNADSNDEYRALCRVLAAQTSTMQQFLSQDLLNAVVALGIHRPLFLTAPVAHVMAPDLWHEGVGAHQDWPALQSGLDTIVAWMPLFDVGLDDYPIEVAPGSHVFGMLPNKAGEHINEVEIHGMEFVPVQMKAGDVLLFSAFTVHRTRTPGKGFRIAYSHRYENAEDKSFLDRGCYSAQSRVIDREIKWAPTPEQVREIFA